MNSKQEDLKRSIQEEDSSSRFNGCGVGYARWIAMAVIHSKKKIRPPV